MSMITARLLGGVDFRDADGGELKLSTRKARALLAFLIIENDRWHTRDKLAALLWGDRGQTQARNSLNQALHDVRKLEGATGVEIIEREPERVRIIPEAVVSDIDDLPALFANSPLRAAELQIDELLGGLDLREKEYVDWLETKLTEYRNALTDALRTLASSAAADHAEDAPLQAARKLVALDPLDEASRRQLMQILADTGNRAEAIRQYQVCASLLKDELGVEPDPKTQALLEQITRLTPLSAAANHRESHDRQELIDTPSGAERPLVAVMRFANLADDPQFGFIADGLAEDLIFSLSAYRSFRVLARTATFRVRETEVDHSDIRRLFGATYAVTGRARRSGTNMRISVELLDCSTGQQIWANRYDQPLDQLFEIEDDISKRIAAAIEPALEETEMRRTLGRPPETLEAYELLQRGYWHVYRGTAEDEAEAWRCIEAAVAKDPTYAGALAGLAYLKYRDAHANFMDNFSQRIEDCRVTAEQALRLDPQNPRALRFLAGANSALENHDIALQSIKRAVELCPSYAQAYSGLAFVQDFIGNFSDAKPAADETIRLRPYDPVLHKCIMSKSIADYQTGEYERAEFVARDSLRTNDSFWLSNMMLAACLGRLHRLEEAKEIIEKMRNQYPGVTLEMMMQKMPFVDPSHRDHLAEGLIQAGWRD
jgi:DNA-binding SARP family transcriptional activator/tetratricopeptide (TPR) repeat protein